MFNNTEWGYNLPTGTCPYTGRSGLKRMHACSSAVNRED